MRRIFGGSRLSLVGALAWGLLFGLAYGQSPLYTSNQNQYFLHGFAQAGVGNLQADWLAGTRDPTPLFSLFTRLMALTSPELLNYLACLLLFALYLISLLAISERLVRLSRTPSASWIFLGLLLLLHSAALRASLSRLPGEWAYLFDGGLGGQRLLGPVFQPSVFGVLLLTSVWRYLEDAYPSAILLTVAAAWVHPTYLLSAATLSAVYWVTLIRQEASLRRPLGVAALALLAVLPVVTYVTLVFLPSSSEAQRILVEFRIPDHALPSAWFGWPSITKLCLIAAATLSTWRTRLRPVMLAAIGVGGALALVQLLSGSYTLALLFPWRLSATLVPLSTAVLAAQAAASVAGRMRNGRPVVATGRVIIALAVLSGIGWSAFQFIEQQRAPERRLFSYVSQTRSPEALYLIPPRLQDFRLATGAPILADFKAIPYRSGEVLEWYARVRMLGWFYRNRVPEIDCGLLEEFSGEYGVTHVVLGPEQRQLECPQLELLYDDGTFALHDLRP